jgi:hypothetical protein
MLKRKIFSVAAAVTAVLANSSVEAGIDNKAVIMDVNNSDQLVQKSNRSGVFPVTIQDEVHDFVLRREEHGTMVAAHQSHSSHSSHSSHRSGY